MCVGCGAQITDQYILRVAPDLEWHASCLRCTDCNQYLDESCTCFVRDGKTYCKRDYVRWESRHFWLLSCTVSLWDNGAVPMHAARDEWRRGIFSWDRSLPSPDPLPAYDTIWTLLEIWSAAREIEFWIRPDLSFDCEQTPDLASNIDTSWRMRTRHVECARKRLFARSLTHSHEGVTYASWEKVLSVLFRSRYAESSICYTLLLALSYACISRAHKKLTRDRNQAEYCAPYLPEGHCL